MCCCSNPQLLYWLLFPTYFAFSRPKQVPGLGCLCDCVERGRLVQQADGNSTGVGNPPGYCYASQPQWSQYRESSFSHGTFDAVNSTHALWSCAIPPAACMSPWQALWGRSASPTLTPSACKYWSHRDIFMPSAWVRLHVQLCRSFNKNTAACLLSL